MSIEFQSVGLFHHLCVCVRVSVRGQSLGVVWKKGSRDKLVTVRKLRYRRDGTPEKVWIAPEGPGAV